MPKLDEYDLKILRVLQQDGRITKLKLAEAVNLSPSPTWERLRKLEEAGIITGYSARLDVRKIAPITTVMVEVVLKRHQREDFEHFESAIQKMPEVVECMATGGGLDYMMRVVTTDVDSYQRFMDRLLESDIGIDRYFSYIVTKPVKKSAGPSLDALLEKLS
ncbi:Lrp/AsnC family transcriptional regulator [Oceanidesulfovibrio marinus]|uniref:Lrp/AsnC family transcriptional regulator n=1 Tax=Oceanidesulfovibrio marinus TaxID=370038 RepID=A0A6P1ZLD4_9BACT|nr:Lrp/AsnC family transcriptional regulator [Oceanidesulfovibrio marinus]TVM35904.1 Lrp/AsnC family transcriptional regulator [Oceanidesulfovibrio marinus]